jgi:hypothetical protein
MPGQRKQAIRERAYGIWGREGRPDGKALDHWLRAELVDQLKMPPSPAVRELFAHWEQGDLLNRLEASHRSLLDRRKYTVEFANPGELPARTASSCLVLQQVLLHRAERLLAAAGTMLLESNIYALALSVRGHYEATAVLGYVCNRLESLKATNIEFPRFAHDIVCAFLGAKHPNHFAKAPDPPNILTCIEKADIYLEAHYSAYAKGCLRDTYDWLSEFAHASNFLSHSSAFTVDTVNSRFVFRHDGELQERDFDLVVYLEISCGFFILLFDHLTRKLTDMGLTM